MRLAGLRSDQQGISREPQFQSKRRIQFKPPQVSSSLRWGDSRVFPRQKDLTRPASPPTAVPVATAGGENNVETPLAPRKLKPSKSSETTSPQEKSTSAHIHRTPEQLTQEPPSNEAVPQVNHVLKKKAGLKSERQKNGRQSSEYQKQFQWKTAVAESPLIAAQQMLYTSNRSIPPYKSNPVELETEYKRSFKGSPPPRAPRLRRDVELEELPPCQRENISPEKRNRKKRRQQRLRRRSGPNEENQEPQPLQQDVRTPQSQKDASPEVRRKVKTEYSSNFCSPLYYCYRDGAWVWSRTIEQEVQELRDKAEAYRKRAWGTHFSRQHLSQILSEQNCFWEASTSSSLLTEEYDHSTSSPIIEALDLAGVNSVQGSGSPGASVSMNISRRSSVEQAELSKDPTLPLLRRLAWDEEASPSDRVLTKIKHHRDKPPVQEPKANEENGIISDHSEHREEKVNVPERKQSSLAVGSGSTNEEGRLPTPKLKTLHAAQRTHHDRTTPATGGAILVSPLKMKHSRTSKRSEPPLGKSTSPYRHLSQASPSQAQSKAESGSLSGSPPAAGMPTLDPLPIREDTWTENTPELSPDPKPSRVHHKQATSNWLMDSYSSHANRIQGTLRNPEFQHNGNLGVNRTNPFVFSSGDSGVSDDDDRMSQISFRSAASCSMASQVLDRAQKRKEEFWGKR
ncbi:nuclear protein MDM1 [Trichomycterus rosablanca]|uniref:nuclear protein MDM1 n=1 Tax=Trichomycterus rosablanca TaxID=2290929 RepID=UPI002F35209E